MFFGIAVIFWIIGSVVIYIYGGKWFMPADQASVQAEAIDDLFRFLLAIGTFIFLLVETTLIFIVVRYGFMRDHSDDTDGPPTHGDTTLEIIWTLIPSVIVFILTIYSFKVLVDTTEARDDEFPINVTAQRFFWQFEYPNPTDDRTLVSQHVLVLPEGENVVMKMNSLDVIHAFWVPAFRMKADVMPGRTTELRFTPNQITGLPPDFELVTLDDLEIPGPDDACPIEEEETDTTSTDTAVPAADAGTTDTEAEAEAVDEEAIVDEEAAADAEAVDEEAVADSEAGTEEAPPVNYENGFDLVCAELCGPNHGLMRGAVFVVEREVYDAYIESLRARSVEAEARQDYAIRCGGKAILEAGRQIFPSFGCNTCHQLFDAGSMAMGQGPTLNGVGTRAATRPGFASPEEYIRTSILSPNGFVVGGFPSGLMPSNFAQRIPADQFELLVQYLLLQTEEG